MIIDLTRPQDLPNRFVHRLNAIDDLCRNNEFSEVLVEISDVSILVREIDAYCHENEIVGIHYTRAVPGSIKERGLLIRSGSEIRSAFLEEHGHRFTSEEITLIKDRWESYFAGMQRSARDNRIFFNFTESALGNGGAEYLIGLYGGEQVAMCFELEDPIGIKLAEIGEPLIVRCALNPSDVKTFMEYPWGKILVSSYHLSKNSEAYGIDQDGYQSVAVAPEKIVEVKALTNQSTRTW
ncbi:MAG TPA: hypothetical protein DCF62_02685 [Porticoccaceae bacterium]|nr:hypothetical protein [Porticoccaceae bacterium]